MLYNRRTGIYKFGNNTYPRRTRRRSNFSHIFWEKSVSCGQENTVIALSNGLYSKSVNKSHRKETETKSNKLSPA
jgi:hypothetical protein